MGGERGSADPRFSPLAPFCGSRIEVEVTFEDVNDLEDIARISEKDDVIAVGKTSCVRRKFRSCSSHMTRKGGQLGTFSLDVSNEVSPCVGAAARF
jgi:hypothetical protein